MIQPAEKPWVIALMGPTASGKTALSIKLAQTLAGEIIACDSRTIYRHMDIGTAKPSRSEQDSIPHHLLDVVEPDQVYTVSQYQEEASAKLAEIVGRGRVPLVCGGTGFYARALLEGLKIPEVAPQENLRAELSARAETDGVESLRNLLRELDPQSADKIGKNDKFRLIRAIEVSQVLGKPFSQAARREEIPYRVIWLGLTADDREILKKRIRERIVAQLAEGLVDEVRTIYMQFGATQTIMNAITYKEYVKFIRGEYSLEEAYEASVQHTISLAKRQLTWFRANPEIDWISIDQKNLDQLFTESMIKISSKMACESSAAT
ncbi:MAG: tRNA (adenosine(37)-N6)-dimethylallyltransferase MiaA [Cyanobacteria bacterium REEB67]|nr:tRNA (adenosine(37)-N6)-dimethylallyltransferase MiaA [Cyanobacteria bacterium REEB67]